MQKVFADADSAIHDIADGVTVMIGGFGLCGTPENLIAALARKGSRDLTIVSNNAGVDGFGVGVLLNQRQIRRQVGTYMGENRVLEQMLFRGEIELELVPQGTFIERIRAGGAGIPAFYTPSGAGTLMADGKETRDFEGHSYLLERALHADFALIKAWKGDRWGNLVYRKTARNFNPEMATAGRVTIAEVEQLVPAGEIPPDAIHTPGIYVHRILQGASYEKRIERRMLRNG